MINLSKLLKTSQKSELCAFPGFCIDYDNQNDNKVENYVLNNTICKDTDFSKLLDRVQIKTNNSRKILNLKPKKQKATTKKMRL